MESTAPPAYMADGRADGKHPAQLYPSPAEYVAVSSPLTLSPSAPPAAECYQQHPQQQSPHAVVATIPVPALQVPADSQSVLGSVNLLVYRDGLMSKSCRITHSDKKKTQAYHMDIPHHLIGFWQANMRRGGPQGSTCFLITKPAMANDVTIQDPSHPERTSVLKKSGHWFLGGEKKFEFKGFDGTLYKWRGHDARSGDLKCLAYPSRTVVAFYHRTKHSWFKEGRLEILPGAQRELDLLVATGFAVVSTLY